MKEFFGTILFASIALLGFSQEDTLSIVPSDEVYDVFLIAGQSNTLNGCCKDPSIQKEDSLILQLGRFDDDNLQVIPARE